MVYIIDPKPKLKINCDTQLTNKSAYYFPISKEKVKFKVYSPKP